MKKQFLIKLVGDGSSLVLAMTVSHFLIYKGLIVPRLPNLSRVPFSWWLGAFAPELAIFIVFGFSLRSWRELLIFSVTAALAPANLSISPGRLGGTRLFEGRRGLHLFLDYWIIVVSLMSAILFFPGMLAAKGKKQVA